MAIDPKLLKGDIALELDVERVSAADFGIAVSSFLSVVREITRQVKGSLPKDAWYVNVQEGSQVLSLTPNVQRLPVAVSDQIISSIVDGFGELESDAATPKNFTNRALEQARVISKLGLLESDREIPVRILTKKRACRVSRRTYDNVSTLIDPDYEDMGSVDGSLEVVSAHNGYEFRIYEPVWDRAVRCSFTEDLLVAALAAFRKRVEVSGLIKYAKNGFPISVKAASIYIFPESSDLPGREDVKGILEIPGGAG